MLVPEALHRLGHSVLETKLCVEPRRPREPRWRGRRAVEPGGDAVVGELRVIQHDGAVHIGLRGRPVGRDGHLDHDRQTRLTLAERRQVR